MTLVSWLIFVAGFLLPQASWAGEQFFYREDLRRQLEREATGFSPELTACWVDKLLDRLMLGKSIISGNVLASRSTKDVWSAALVDCAAHAKALDLDEFRVDHATLGKRYVLVRGQGYYLMGQLFLKKTPGDMSPVPVDIGSVDREARLRVVRHCSEIWSPCELLVGGTAGEVAFQLGLLAQTIVVGADSGIAAPRSGTSSKSDGAAAVQGPAAPEVRRSVPRAEAAPRAADAVRPSYDCGKASVYAESLVCSDRELAYMDRLVAALYRNERARNAARPDGEQSTQGPKEQQIAWIKRRNLCVDRACVRSAYVSRASTLERGVPPALVGGDLPLKRCQSDSIKQVRPRLEGDFSGGVYATYTSGGIAVSYEAVPEVIASKPGDPILVCLVELPKNCPKGDDRGRLYFTHNLRTGENWTLQDSQHGCGGA